MCLASEIRKSGSSTVNPFCSTPLTGPQWGSRLGCSPGHYFNSHCMQTPAGIPGDVKVCEFRRLTGREVVETREKP
ncbi:hypothetical protein CBM2637_B140004 [Cupriavidus taiwanensis]|nr:hypothetical protein CBM2637_B140004 [Cupriavidus taiwanensis]SPA54668.1 protein of unknown function [Cupriavidus taiwanensis]